jgi:hypothetical protein
MQFDCCGTSCTEVSILLVTFIAELSITLDIDITEASLSKVEGRSTSFRRIERTFFFHAPQL